MQKKVTITIDDEVNERWNKVAKFHKITKSSMVEEYIRQMLPILEQKTPNNMMAEAMKKMAESINVTADLFQTPTYDERTIYDESVEQYKIDKRGEK